MSTNRTSSTASMVKATVFAAALAAGGILAATAPSNAMSSVRVQQPAVAAATNNVVQVKHGHHGGHHNGWHNKWGHGYGHIYYGGYNPCFWTKQKVWDPYFGGYVWRSVQVCR